MTKPLPLPSIELLKRLQVENELLIDAERWQVAHNYHDRRQNVHYQSVNQPGIVCGLGVRIIESTDKDKKDKPAIQIQPGIAIDLYGNIIVVPNPENFLLDYKKSQMVYVVVSFVDGKESGKSRNNGEEYNPIVTETFKILQKTDEEPVSSNEVEVCRIRLNLQNENIELTTPEDVFNPVDNELDLRYRVQPETRPQAIVKLATIKKEDSQSTLDFSNLSLRSLTSLYPALQVADFQEKDFANISDYSDYNLLFLKESQVKKLSESEVEPIKEYLKRGGVVLIEVPLKITAKYNILTKQKLQEAIAKINTIKSSDQDSELATLVEIIPDLEENLKEIKNSLKEEINRERKYFSKWLCLEEKTTLENWEELDLNHPLRTEPFLFSALPLIEGIPIQILTGGGIIIIIGDLSSAWEFNTELALSRETIRTAQEMLINILHFAWRRRQMTQLLS